VVEARVQQAQALEVWLDPRPFRVKLNHPWRRLKFAGLLSSRPVRQQDWQSPQRTVLPQR
jgi:hypothetical protein